MKKYLVTWFVVIFVAIMAYFKPAYCESPGDFGVTDGVTPRFAKPGKFYQEKKDTAEPVNVEETKKAFEEPAAGIKKKDEGFRFGNFFKKFMGDKKTSDANKVEGVKNARDPKTVENEKK